MIDGKLEYVAAKRKNVWIVHILAGDNTLCLMYNNTHLRTDRYRRMSELPSGRSRLCKVCAAASHVAHDIVAESDRQANIHLQALLFDPSVTFTAGYVSHDRALLDPVPTITSSKHAAAVAARWALEDSQNPPTVRTDPPWDDPQP